MASTMRCPATVAARDGARASSTVRRRSWAALAPNSSWEPQRRRFPSPPRRASWPGWQGELSAAPVLARWTRATIVRFWPASSASSCARSSPMFWTSARRWRRQSSGRACKTSRRPWARSGARTSPRWRSPSWIDPPGSRRLPRAALGRRRAAARRERPLQVIEAEMLWFGEIKARRYFPLAMFHWQR